MTRTVLLIAVLGCALSPAQFHLPGTGGGKTSNPQPAPAAPATSAAPAAAPAPAPAPAQTQAEPAAPGSFDYYVLSLSWAPNFCADPANAATAPNECAAGKHVRFVVHGLWPQSNEAPSPESCQTTKPVSKGVLSMILPYMLTPGLVQHEWAAHGTCSGLTPPDYFTNVMEARVAVQFPVQLTSLDGAVTESPSQVEAQFAGANPSFPPNAFRTACRGGDLTEVRVCFTRDMKPRECTASARECAAPTMRIRPPR
jgi:ribonuclease T2